MRINAKGQVTIPVRIRQQAGLHPRTEVEIVYEGRGIVLVRRSLSPRQVPGRGRRLVAHLRGRGDVDLSTAQIMALTRRG